MSGPWSWLAGAALILPAFILAFVGLIHFKNGYALDAAFPVPYALALNIVLPKSAYEDAEPFLRYANQHDGSAQIWLAETRFHAGEKPQNLSKQVELGLLRAPASAEGWAFYARTLAQTDPRRAASALGQAFILAPFDYFWASTRAQLSAVLWNHLDDDARSSALREVRLLWEEPALREQVLPLLASPEGRALVTRAYKNEPEAIRAINRFVSATVRQSKTGNR